MKILKFYLTICLSLTVSVLSAQIEVYVSSVLDSTIKKYDENGTYLGNFIAPFSGGLNRPQALIFMDDNTVIVTGYLNSQIKQYNATTGVYIGNFSSGYNLTLPTRMRIRDDNLIYVLQNDATVNKVVRFDLDGNFVDEFTSIGVPGAIGMDWDDNGNLYVASFGGAVDGYVQKFDAAGNDLGTFIDSTILQGPTYIWFNDAGDLLLMDWTDGVVRRFDSNGQYIDDFITGMTNPEGVEFLPDDTILVGDRGTDSVERFDSNGNFIETFTSGNNLGDPNAIVFRDPILSVSEKKIEKVFVTPTIGAIFNFNTTITPDYKSLNIYSSNGLFIEKINLLDNVSWDARAYAEGIYFIVANQNGVRETQKIVVKK